MAEPGADRVLHYVSHALPLERGYTIRTHGLARALAEAGWEVTVADQVPVDPAASLGPPTGDDAFRRDDVLYLRPPRPSLLGNLLARLAARGVRGANHLRRQVEVARLARRIERRAGKPQLVHVHSPTEIVPDARRMARRWGVPLLYEVRGFWELSDAAEHGRIADLEAAVSADVREGREVDRVIAIGRQIAGCLLDGGLTDERVAVLPNAVDARRFAPREPETDLARELGVSDRVVFGCGTLVRRLEGLEVLARAWPRVIEQVPEAVFLLVGDGPFLPRLERLRHELGIAESFRLLGRVDQRRMAEIYSLFHVFVLPRLPERVCEIVTPLKPLEAMAMGIPVVASDLPALREMIHDGRTGLLFRAGDAAAAAAACIALARDAGLRRRLGEAARLWVTEERDWSRVGAECAELYRATLNGRVG